MPWGMRASTHVGRCNESVSASVPSRSKRSTRYKALELVEDHVQGAGDDEQGADVQEDKEVSPLPALPERARLVLGHRQEHAGRAAPPATAGTGAPRTAGGGG